MDDESGDDDKDGFSSEWGGESRQDDEINLRVDSDNEVMHI